MISYYGGTIGTHQCSFERYHPRPPMAFPSQNWELANPNPKLQSVLFQERVKLYGLQNWPIPSQGPSEQNPMKNSGIAQIFWVFEYPLLSQERVSYELQNFEFCTRIHRIDPNKSTLKISGKVHVAVGLKNFQGTHYYIGCIASHGHLCGSSAFLFLLVLEGVQCDAGTKYGEPLTLDSFLVDAQI